MSNITFHQGTDDIEHEASNIEMSKVCVAMLQKFYPGHFWQINADIRGGVVNVINPEVSTKHCYTVVPFDWSLQEVAQAMMKAGGEVLERGGLSRGRLIADEVLTAKRDILGNIRTEN